MSVLDNVLVALRRGRLGGTLADAARAEDGRAAEACSPSSATTARSHTPPATCRTSTDAWSRSRARSRCGRACCCWTSPPPG